MMGIGYWGNGVSSSSSSNLSPLAPPFTVDRSNPTPFSNPPAPFTEPPYPYLGSRPVFSPGAHIPTFNPNVTAASNTLTFLQYSSGIPSNCVEPKSYYTSSVAPVVDDDAIPLVALNDPSYDLLSTSSQVDYTRSLSGHEYTPSWGNFWNRLADEEQGDRHGNSCLEEMNDAGSYAFKKYMKQGACTADGSSKGDESSAASGKQCVDVFGRSCQFVSPSAGKLNDKSSSRLDPMFICSASLRPSISGTNSTLQESHVQVPSLQPASNFWNHQNPYGATNDKWFHSLNSGTNDCVSVKKPSPALVIRPPPVGTSSKRPTTVSSKDVTINSKDSGCHNPSNQNEPLLPSSDGKAGCLDTGRPISDMERSNQVFDGSSSTRKEELFNSKGGLDHMPKAGNEFQLPDINVPYGITSLDSATAFTSLEYSSEDHCNPAVDSPCWKGAPASHFSPPEASEAVTPGTRNSPPSADDNIKVSWQNLCEHSVGQENAYVELGSLLCPDRPSNAVFPTGEHSSADAVKAGFIYPKPSSSSDFQFSNDINKSKKEYDVPNGPKSNSDLNPSHTKQPGLDKGDFISARVFKLCADVAESGLNTNDALEDGSTSFHGMEGSSCFPCSVENVNKLVKMPATESGPKMNVKMLVDTMHNLSELLLFHCSNDSFAVSEQDHEALKHIINNLNACISKRNVHTTPIDTQQCTSHPCTNLPDHNKGVISSKSPVLKEGGASSEGQFDHDSIHEGKRNGNIRVKEVEKFSDFVYSRGNADIVKDDKMVQAIKEVLKEDFNGEEEIESETLLYKNLWLEAEAALCSISYRARFNRMKIEMEYSNSLKAKDVPGSTKAVDKLPNANLSPNPNMAQKVIPETIDSPLSDNNIQEPPISSSAKVVDDVEASIFARLHVLKSRGENSNSLSTQEQPLIEGFHTEFTVRRDERPLLGDQSEDGSLDMTMGPYLQYCSGNTKLDKPGSYNDWVDHEATKELRVTDDQMIQSCWNNRPGSQLPSGWVDGPSSDWEHVLRDEVATPN